MKKEEIYNLITNSAKKRFNYNTFEKTFLGEENVRDVTIEYNVPDKILWYMLMYLAMGDEPDIVADKIYNEILMSGFIFDVNALEKIIVDNVVSWKKEIGVLKMATDMLNSENASVEQVYQFVSKMLVKG